MDYNKAALELHSKFPGKIAVQSLCECKDRDALSTAYTPGVAEPCRKIKANPDDVYTYTMKGRTVAVVTNGTAVLGLGNIGPLAGKPVMEGKGMLFKMFADVDVFDLELATTDPDELINVVKTLEPTFGGINLEDISAPRCFEIERRLQEECDIPVFHDDQHGTAVVTLAAVINALKLTNRKIENIKAVTSGAGAAGIAIVKLLIAMGLKNVIMCDRHGAIYKGRDGQNHEKELIADISNQNCEKGTLADVIKGADLFIGVSAPNCVTEEMVKSMAPQPILFPMANPDPEILPELAKKAGAAVVGTGRSDYPNQINNVLAFPGIFRGALDVRASRINDEMNIAAARAIAESVPADKLCSEYIIPDALDHQMAQRVAEAVRKAAIETGVARIK